MSEVQDNPERQRFELALPGAVAFIDYRRNGKTVSLVHAEVPPQFEGKGYGSQLAKGTLDLLRAEGSKVIPRCAFVVAYLKRHPAYQDLVDS
jgi:predicted GNAT family acetyltransferase